MAGAGGLWGATDAAPAIAVSFRVPPRSNEFVRILANLQLSLLGYPAVGGCTGRGALRTGGAGWREYALLLISAKHANEGSQSRLKAVRHVTGKEVEFIG